jgi:hypothetical protein
MGEGEKFLLCPYCGHVQPAAARCVRCGGLFETLSRDATQTTMGPWFVRDAAQPFLPGCSYEVLVRQAQSGRLTGESIVRGPTTRQFWMFARHVPGVAHLVGLCHRCGSSVDPLGSACGSCGSVFVRPTQRNELGLQYPSPQAAAEAQRRIREHRGRVAGAGAGVLGDHGAAEGADAASQRPEASLGLALAALADPGDRPAQGAYSIGQLVSALSVEAAEDQSAEDQPATTAAQLRRNMRVRMAGRPLGQGMWLAFAAAAGILALGIVLLVVTHG